MKRGMKMMVSVSDKIFYRLLRSFGSYLDYLIIIGVGVFYFRKNYTLEIKIEKKDKNKF